MAPRRYSKTPVPSPCCMLLALMFMLACTTSTWEAPEPGTVMAALTISDRTLTARVVATEIQGAYIFEIREGVKGRVLEERTISVPVGYHPHVVSITWNEGKRTVIATIDHDFGDNNALFILHAAKTGT